jgi:hypothetical protein
MMKPRWIILAAAGLLAARVWSDGTLIEAEAPANKRSEFSEFGTAYKDPSAFGGAALSRFFLLGSCVYEFSAPETGEYDLWLRYSANQNRQLTYDIAVDGKPSGAATETAALAATGGLEIWNWIRLERTPLKAGRVDIVLHHTNIRVDCLWIGRSGSPPQSPQVLLAGREDEMRRQYKNPIEPVVPDWLAETDPYTLPEWYDSIRVCAHTRLSWPWLRKDSDTFLRAGEKLSTVGFKEIVRHVRGGGEAAWWPSAVGDIQPEARTRNFAQEIIDEAHAAGCRIILYHRHMEDEGYAREHPECRVLDAHGDPVIKRGPKVCLNTPFADFVQTRLVELAKMGADGFYFDEVHIEKPFCWCPACQAGFKRETGLDYPNTSDPFDPAFQKAVEYKNVLMERIFRRWRAAIHAVNPDCVLLIGSNTYPAMNDRHFTDRLARISDSLKTEFNLPARVGPNRIFSKDGSLAPPEADARIALGYAICRDACDGRPAHVWANNLSDSVQARFATAGMIAHGMVANLDVQENRLPDKDLFTDAVSLGNRVSPAFAGLRPIRWGLIHFSERARDYYLPNEAEAWQRVLYPTYGAFTAMLRAHLPVGIITDSQLEQGRLEGCRILFLPSAEQLTAAMKKAVEQFRANGGQVIEQRPEWEWNTATGASNAVGEVLAAVSPVSSQVPVTAGGGPLKMHLVAFSNETSTRLTVALVNDFSWVQTGDAGRADPALGGETGQQPEPCRNVVVKLHRAECPKQVIDVVSGQSLPVRGAAGEWMIDLPEFDCMTVLDIR